jgi:hypothetical protein
MALNYAPLRRLRPPPNPANRPSQRSLSKKPRRTRQSPPTTQLTLAGFLPTFPPTSSAELDAAIRAFKTHVLEPGVLTGAQKKLLRDPSQRAYLESEEVTARFGDSVVRLIPWDSKLAAAPLSSEAADGAPTRPRTHALFRDALRLSTSPDDLAAVWPDLLASLRASRHAKLRETWLSEWLTHARARGAAGAVVAVLRERSRIGVPLAGEEGKGNARTARLAICEHARVDQKDRTRLEEALGWVEKVNRLVEMDAAKGSWLERRGPRDVLSFAVPMEIAALLSLIEATDTATASSVAGDVADDATAEDSTGEEASPHIKRFETYGETTVKYLERLLDVLKSNVGQPFSLYTILTPLRTPPFGIIAPA